MKRARFVAPAREEFLEEVAYYDQVQQELIARMLAMSVVASSVAA